MEYEKVLRRVYELVDEVKVGILTTVDASGYPRSRWMTPAVLPRLSGDLYAVSPRSLAKIEQISAHAKVGWAFQTKNLDKIATLEGEARVFEDPGLVAELLESIGRYLSVLWRVSPEPRDLVVIETSVERASFFLPRTRESFEAEARHGR